MSKDEINALQQVIDNIEKSQNETLKDNANMRSNGLEVQEQEREKNICEKDRNFFKSKAERLEEQLFTREKAYIRLEADSNYNTDQTIQGLKAENETLREELMSNFFVLKKLKQWLRRSF